MIKLIFWQLNDNQMIMATHPPHADQVWRGQIVRAQRSNGNIRCDDDDGKDQVEIFLDHECSQC